MTIRESSTEQLIKNTAKRIYFAEGHLHATTQDIADAAGVSRTSLHYYFRSRDHLISQVFNEAIEELSERLYQLMDSPLPFKEKMEKLIDLFLTETIAYPYRETFMVQEMLAGSAGIDMQKEKGAIRMKPFLKQIKNEMEAGNLEAMDPVQFMMNVIALTSHPIMMRPLHKNMFQLSDGQFNKLMDDRKRLIYKMIMK